MKHLSRVLAAVDFSNPARSAFGYALALARRHGAELVAVQAVPAEEPFNRGGRQRLALKTSLEREARNAQVGFTYRVQHGDSAEIILLHARSLRPDVIVVGSRPRRGLARLRAGSVSERVVAGATVPVLLVPARLRPAAAGPFRHVAVAVGLMAGSNAAIERALALASDTADRITLLHVVPGFSAGVPPHLHRYGVADYQSHLVRDARRELQVAAVGRRPSRAAVHTRILRGDTTAELSRVVDSMGADLLIVGAPRRGVVARALLGTVAARLLQVIDVPVLAIPGGGRGTDQADDVPLPRAA